MRGKDRQRGTKQQRDTMKKLNAKREEREERDRLTDRKTKKKKYKKVK